MKNDFTPGDFTFLSFKGLDVAEVRNQWSFLQKEAVYVSLDRPCTPGDGIIRLSEEEAAYYASLYDEKKEDLHVLKFVPASGSATRMFSNLSEPGSKERRLFFNELKHFPFYPLLEHIGSDHERLLEYLLSDSGLSFNHMPKGMIPFHAYAKSTRTAINEHIAEAAYYVLGSGRASLHFTFSEKFKSIAEQHISGILQEMDRDIKDNIEISCSAQDASTDTIAMDAGGKVLRDENGQLVLRPSGHGALLKNLSAQHADIVFIKNIDNVQTDRLKHEMAFWKKALAGYLLYFLSSWEDNRPVRVCGMVPNKGEPGGGPFWIEGNPFPQIVERTQIDLRIPSQRKILQKSRYFNPVDIVCAFKKTDGEMYALEDYSDKNVWIIAEKKFANRSIKVLERPGLWNAGMAWWHSIFIEVPLNTFTPVKHVNDLLRPEHRCI